MVFVSPCSGIDPSSALRAVFVNKSVDLGHSSHFCLPRMAPELKFIEALCQSVCTCTVCPSPPLPFPPPPLI